MGGLKIIIKKEEIVDKISLYLGGHVSNTPGFREWRKQVKNYLVDMKEQIHFYDPTDNDEAIFDLERDDYVVGSLNEKASFNRCLWQMYYSDVFLFNLTYNVSKVSIGTIWEMGWGYANNKYMITVVTPEQNEVLHPFINFSNVIYTDLYEAVKHISVLIK